MFMVDEEMAKRRAKLAAELAWLEEHHPEKTALISFSREFLRAIGQAGDFSAPSSRALKCDCKAADGSDRGTCIKCGRQFARLKGVPCEMVTFGDSVREMDYADDPTAKAIAEERLKAFNEGLLLRTNRPKPEGK